MNYPKLSTLSQTPPFSFLPRQKLEQIQHKFIAEQGQKNEIKFVERQTKVKHLYLLSRGSAELYFEKGREKVLRRILSEGDCFGGISMLVNNANALRTMKLREDTLFYKLPADIFQKLCDEYEDFKEFFTNTFGKKMLDRSFADMISRQVSGVERSSPFFDQKIGSVYNQSFLQLPGHHEHYGCGGKDV